MRFPFWRLQECKLLTQQHINYRSALDEFIKKNTYIEFYDEPLLDSFKGRGRVKIFQGAAGIYLVIDESHMDPTKTNPNVTHVLHLESVAR